MIVPGNQHRHARLVGGVADAPVHREAAGDCFAKSRFERRARHIELRRLEFETQEEASTFGVGRSEEHTSELQSLMRISYAVFCLKKKKKKHRNKQKLYQRNRRQEATS